MWGAVILTSYPGRASLKQVAEQRVQVAWRPQLGDSFALLGRDSLGIVGYPAIHLSVSGTIGQVALRVEEYVIARRRDLIVLQFRYPRAAPYDSIAVGYRRVLDGLRDPRSDERGRAPAAGCGGCGAAAHAAVVAVAGAFL